MSDPNNEAPINNYDVEKPIADPNTRDRVAMLEARVREMEEQLYVCLSWMRTQAEAQIADGGRTAKPPKGAN